MRRKKEQINGKFDYIVSRAVTDLGNFMPWVKGKYINGIIYLKGGDLTPGGELYNEISNAAVKCGIRKDKITFCSINEWFNNEFFETKKVIYISK